ncbi:hypothetical protein BKA63DRAFT_543616 [Paraphoma chrysanthemicola]|nr:hypothetical protein BKA63DRAFT_543616 [Paraphoma chrysanthemicola]
MAPSIATTQHCSTPSSDKFKVIVVGAGIAGLLTAIGLRLDDHNVTILEQSSTFGEVGAGIRIPPNSFKILHWWGIDLTYMKKTYSNGNRFLRYDTGNIIADMPHGVLEWDFGGSYMKVHRADYHNVLLNKAVEPSALLGDGTRIDGDLIVVADGVQSTARPIFQGHEMPPVDTSDIVYRVLIPGQEMLSDPDLRDLISQPWVSSWCGLDAHVISYSIRGREIYNVVYCCSAHSTFLKWRLYDLDMVEYWVYLSNKGVLVGNAVHPMLPYMASGAAIASLAKYQKLRQPRASIVQKAGRALQDAYHLPDGLAQQERDEWMVKDDARNPIFWGHKERREWLFGHDAELF